MLQLSIFSFSHKNIDLNSIGALVIPDEHRNDRLNAIKMNFHLSELSYIATCNRVEFIMVSENMITHSMVDDLIHTANTALTPSDVLHLSQHVQVFHGIDAVNHLMRVSSSLESMVVGEKEILAQVRQQYQQALENRLTGDFLRILDKQVVKTAKKVYSNTSIADRPVSIVSLAYRLLKEHNLKLDSRILIIGAGETNQLVSKYLNKQGFKNSVVFNRTLAKAETLAKALGGQAFALDKLVDYKNGFDIIITCTSANEPILNKSTYQQLIGEDTSHKIIVDLALPADTSTEVIDEFNVHYIALNSLKEIAASNIEKRKLEVKAAEIIIQEGLQEFEKLIKERQIELALQMVPSTVKNIRKIAIEEVFAQDINSLDEHSKQVLNKVLDYFEKKYISVPIKAVKNIYIQ